MSDLMTFADYQQFILNTGFYPAKREPGQPANVQGLAYTALGLTGEAGEVADKVKKILRDYNGTITSVGRDSLIKELGDVLWYLTASANELNITLAEVARINVEKIEGRTARGTRQGEGDDR